MTPFTVSGALSHTVRRVDVPTLAREIAVPAPLALQRRVDEWLEALRDDNGCTLAGASFDPLDALRSQLLMRGSSALANAEVAREVAVRHTGKIVLLERDGGDVPIGILRSGQGRPLLALPSLGALAIRLRETPYVLYHELKLMRSGRWSRSNGARSARSILLLPRELGHLSDLLPLAAELRQRHGIEAVFLATAQKLSRRLREAGHDPVQPENWYEPLPVAWKAVAAAGMRSAKRADDLVRSGLNGFRRPELRALARVAYRVLFKGMWEIRRVATGTARLIEFFRPELVVVGNPYTLEGRVAAHVTRAAGLPSAAIQHGAIFPGDPRWHRCPVDRMCVWGDFSRRALLDSGVAENAIRVTGSLRLDAALADWKSSAFGAEASPSVLVATSGPGDLVTHAQHQEFIAMLYDAASRLPALRVVVKLHPKDREEHYRPAALRWPAARVELRRGDASRHGLDIYDFLRPARALITVSSTTALDAMAVGVPVIAVKVSGTADALNHIAYLNAPLAARATSADELARLLARDATGDGASERTSTARSYAGQHFSSLGRALDTTTRALLELSREAG